MYRVTIFAQMKKRTPKMKKMVTFYCSILAVKGRWTTVYLAANLEQIL